MPKKPKFKPEITKVKLNPEQAVLQCTCYTAGAHFSPNVMGTRGYIVPAEVGYCESYGSKGSIVTLTSNESSPDAYRIVLRDGSS